METIPEDHIRAWAYQKLRSYFIGIASGTGSYCIKEDRRKYVSHEYQEDYCKHYPYGDGNRNQLFVPLFAHLLIPKMPLASIRRNGVRTIPVSKKYVMKYKINEATEVIRVHTPQI